MSVGHRYAELWRWSFDDSRLVRMFFARIAIIGIHAALITVLMGLVYLAVRVSR